ncbi:hypothetical protein [Desulfurococcus amylolyticus]|uniref:hypothetical protein n=1 Tax=Desulfurococcus amylolyticus TaxID=94694 RepID=UPI0012FF3539|nr:hypothetical protein [Desulfurococcus amylolyticus]
MYIDGMALNRNSSGAGVNIISEPSTLLLIRYSGSDPVAMLVIANSISNVCNVNIPISIAIAMARTMRNTFIL